jgi:hypothetical protein
VASLHDDICDEAWRVRGTSACSSEYETRACGWHSAAKVINADERDFPLTCVAMIGLLPFIDDSPRLLHESDQYAIHARTAYR